MEPFHCTTKRAAAEASPDDLRAQLKRANLRITAPRLAILRAVREADGHPDVAALLGAAKAQLGSLSTQAAYNILASLEGAGLVRRIEPAGGPARFEARVGDNHHHVVCRRCGATADADCQVGRAPCLQPTAAHGFEIDEAEIVFWGVCPACQALAAHDRKPGHRRRPSEPTS